jgi:hypothetical protein
MHYISIHFLYEDYKMNVSNLSNFFYDILKNNMSRFNIFERQINEEKENEKNGEKNGEKKEEQIIVPKPNKLQKYPFHNFNMERIKKENIDSINKKTLELIANNKKLMFKPIFEKCDGKCNKYKKCNIFYDSDNNSDIEKNYNSNNKFSLVSKLMHDKMTHKTSKYNKSILPFLGGMTLGIGFTTLLFYGKLNFKCNK